MILTHEALRQVREAVGAPRTLHYLYSTSTEAWFGDLEPRQAIAWLDLLQWRRDGRPMVVEWTVNG